MELPRSHGLSRKIKGKKVCSEETSFHHGKSIGRNLGWYSTKRSNDMPQMESQGENTLLSKQYMA